MSHQSHADWIRSMLQEIGAIAENATLTGSLASGAGEGARRYNAALEHLVRDGHVPSGIFAPLPETADWGQIGVSARLLAKAIGGQEARPNATGPRPAGPIRDPGILCALAPFMESDDLAELVEECLNADQDFDEGILVALAPFVGSETLGRLLRSRRSHSASTAATPAPPKAPQAPAPQEAPDIPDSHQALEARGEVPELPQSSSEHERRW